MSGERKSYTTFLIRDKEESTIFTSNFHPNELNKKFESRKIDRILNKISNEQIICLELLHSYLSRNRPI